MNETTTTLTDAQIAKYHEDGYMSIDAIISQDELKQLREIYDRIFNERMGWEEGRQFDLGGDESGDKPVLPQVMTPSQYFPELLETEYHKNARAIAKQLIGEGMHEQCGEHMIYKPAEYGGVTPWHQDQAYHNPNNIVPSVNFWMPLDDATVDSGCLQFVPGSHRQDVLPHHSINHDPRVHGLEVDNPEKCFENAVACPVPAGGCTLHADCMLHYANPNTSTRPRRAYTLVFRGEAIARETPIDNYWMRDKMTKRLERAKAAEAKK